MKILHVLDMALPYLTTGYAIRSNYILTNQKQIGLRPVVLTRHSHIGYEGDKRHKEIRDGIPYLWGPTRGIAFRAASVPWFNSDPRPIRPCNARIREKVSRPAR